MSKTLHIQSSSSLIINLCSWKQAKSCHDDTTVTAQVKSFEKFKQISRSWLQAFAKILAQWAEIVAML